MSTVDLRNYYRKREATARDFAQRAASPEAAAAHRMMAETYRDRAQKLDEGAGA